MRIKALLLSMLFVLVASFPARTQNGVKLDELKREAVGQVTAMQVFTQPMGDQIFSYSELGFQEYETSRYVTGILEKNGFKVERGVVGIQYPTVKP